MKLRFDIKGFRDFILRGNVVDLAIAVVIGAAFAAVVAALIRDVITPLIGAIFGGHGAFGDLSFEIHHSQFNYGDLIDTLLTFVVIAAVVYFLVVVPVGALMAPLVPTPAEPQPTKECPECKSSIPATATRCAFCTVEQ